MYYIYIYIYIYRCILFLFWFGPGWDLSQLLLLHHHDGDIISVVDGIQFILVCDILVCQLCLYLRQQFPTQITHKRDKKNSFLTYSYAILGC